MPLRRPARLRIEAGYLRAALLLLGRKLVVSLVEVRHDVLLVLGEELQAQLAVAERHLRLELGQRRDLPVLAQVDRLRVAQRLVVVAGLALLLFHELASLGGVARGEGWEGEGGDGGEKDAHASVY